MTTDAIKLEDALRQELEAARKQLNAAKIAGKRDHVLTLAGYIGGLQVAIDICVKGKL